MVLIFIKPYLSGCFASIIKSSDAISVIANAIVNVTVSVTIGITVNITIKDGWFYPVAVTVTIYIYILIISDARRQAVI